MSNKDIAIRTSREMYHRVLDKAEQLGYDANGRRDLMGMVCYNRDSSILILTSVNSTFIFWRHTEESTYNDFNVDRIISAEEFIRDDKSNIAFEVE